MTTPHSALAAGRARQAARALLPFLPSTLVAVLLGVLLTVALWFALALSAAPAARAQSAPAAPVAPAAPAVPTDVCDGVTAVPPAECRSLVALYASTGGSGWLQRDGWLSAGPDAPCDWHGVACNGGHVRGLHLRANRLGGALPGALGALEGLTSLDLSDNLIGGDAPYGLCALTDTVAAADFSHNRLHAPSSAVAACLDALDPGWAATQTAPPAGLRAAAFYTDGFDIAWTPIAYSAGNGGYEVAVMGMGGSFAVQGVTPDKGASSYRIAGLEPGRSYMVRVRTLSAPGGGQSFAQVSDDARLGLVTLGSERVLFAVYFAADNDLSPYAPHILRRLQRGTRFNPNADVVYFADMEGEGNSAVWHMAGGVITPTTAVAAEWGSNEVDASSPEALAWFLTYARTAYPHARAAAAVIGHGVGLAPEIAWPEEAQLMQAARAAAEPAPLPREKDATATDVTDGSYMSTADYGSALSAATAGFSDPFDLIFFDQCFQGSLDALYEVRGAAEQFVASPNYAWLSAPYDRYLAALAPAATPAQMADSILQIYQNSLDDSHPNAILRASAADIAAVFAAANSLADALTGALAAGQAAPILAASSAAQFVDTAQCGQADLHLGPPDEQIGATSFAYALRSHFPAGDPAGVYDAAGALLTALAPLEQTYRVGVPYIAPGEYWDYRDLLTLLAPLRRDLPPGVAWRASIYRDGAPFAATWSGTDPATGLPFTSTVTVGATFAAARDGRWDDFIAAWYARGSAGSPPPAVGEWCRYTPPAIVVDESAADLPAAVVRTGPTSARAEWQPVPGATEYLLLARAPGDVAWRLVAAVPAPTTAYDSGALRPGWHALRILAVDTDETVVAQSAVLTFYSGTRLFLPTIAR